MDIYIGCDLFYDFIPKCPLLIGRLCVVIEIGYLICIDKFRYQFSRITDKHKKF